MPSPDPPERPLSLAAAVLPLLTMLVLLTAGAAFLDVGNELLVLVMLGAAAVAGVVAARVGRTWDDVQRATGEKLAAVLPAILILLAIGMLIGTWILSGTIPMLVYAGLHLVSPQYLVVTAFLATAVTRNAERTKKRGLRSSMPPAIRAGMVPAVTQVPISMPIVSRIRITGSTAASFSPVERWISAQLDPRRTA